MHRTSACLHGVALFVLAGRALATPIQYSFSTSATGNIGSQAFSDRATTMILTADTNTIVYTASPRSWSVAAAASISISGIGTANVSTAVAVFNNGTVLGISRIGGPTDILDLFLAGTANYGLNTPFGPVTSTNQGGNWTALPVASTLGAIDLTSAGPYTFQALVPAPGSALALGVGGLAAAQARRRRRGFGLKTFTG